METHHYRMKIGRHKDELITRVPVSYLKWLANQPNHVEQDYAKAELARRGTVTPSIEVSGHAIDRASLSCMPIFRKSRHDNEGLHAWLCRVGMAALQVPQKKNGKHPYGGMLFAFAKDGEWPVLKTVMRDKPKGKHKHAAIEDEDDDIVPDRLPMQHVVNRFIQPEEA